MTDPLDFFGVLESTPDPLDFFGVLESTPDPLDFFGPEPEEERKRREARERIRRNMRLGAEQATRLDLPERGGSTLGEAAGATFWGDFAGGLAEMGALPGVLGQSPGLPGLGIPNPLQVLPESYKQKSREVAEAVEYGREQARVRRFEAGVDSPAANALIGAAAENADLVAGLPVAGVKGVRALGRTVDDLGRIVSDAAAAGMVEGGRAGVAELSEGLAQAISRDLPRHISQLEAASARRLSEAEKAAALQRLTERAVAQVPSMEARAAVLARLEKQFPGLPVASMMKGPGGQEILNQARHELSQRTMFPGYPERAYAGPSTRQRMEDYARTAAAREFGATGQGVGAPAPRSAPAERKPVPVALEAMEHAGSGASPEAAARMAGGTRFYEVSPSGEVTPIIGQDAVDRPARRGRAKVRVSANGEVVVESGKLSEAGRRALGDVRPQQPRPSIFDEEPAELDLDAAGDEDFLRQMGVTRPADPGQRPRASGAPADPEGFEEFPVRALPSRPIMVRVKRYGDPEAIGDGVWFTSRDDPSRGATEYYKGRREGGEIAGVLAPRNPLILEGGEIRQFASRAATEHILGPEGYANLMERLAQADLRGEITGSNAELNKILREYGATPLPRAWNNGSVTIASDRLGPALARREGYDAIVHHRGAAGEAWSGLWADEVIDLSDGRNFRLLGESRLSDPPDLAASKARSLRHPAAAASDPAAYDQAVKEAGEEVASGKLPEILPKAERKALDPEGGYVDLSSLSDWFARSFFTHGPYKAVARDFVDPRIQKTLGEWLPRRVERAAAEEREALRQMANLSREIDRTTADLAKASGGRVTAAWIRRELDAAYRSGDGLSPDLAQAFDPEGVAVLDELRGKVASQLDNLSRQFVEEGVVDESGAATILGNLSRYLHTSHEAFDNPRFLEKVRGSAAWNEARAFVKSEFPDATEEEVIGVLSTYADRFSGPRPPKASKVGSIGRKDLRELMKRDDVPEPIRHLMGLHQDFKVNFEKTSALLAHDLAQHRMLRDVAEELRAVGVLQEASPVTGKGVGAFYRPIGGAEVRSPLAGLYTTPRVAELVEGALKQSEANWFYVLSGLVKFGKVAISPETQARNWASGWLMSMANGNFLGNPRYLVRSAQAQKHLIGQTAKPGTENRLLRFMGAGTAQELEADISRATKLGVIGRGASGREFLSYMDDIGQGPKGLRGLTDNKPVGYLSRAYMGGDDFWKLANWKQEVDKLDWAYGKGRVSRELLEEEAAEIVSQQLQTYDRAAPLGRALSRQPWTSPFATFYVEMPRNLLNIGRRAAHEAGMAKKALAAGDTAQAMRWSALAGQRVVGMGAALTTMGAVKKYLNRESGMTGDKEEAIRRIALPPWSENAQVAIVSRDGDEVTYFDGSFVDPYNMLQRMWVGIVARPGDLDDRIGRAFQELYNTFGGPELLTGSIIETVANKDLSTGQPVTYPHRMPMEQAADYAANAALNLAPGIVGTVRKVVKHGSEAGAHMLGFRTVNLRDRFGYKVREFNTARNGVSADFNRGSKNRDGSPKSAEEIAKAQEKAEREWSRAYKRLMESAIDMKNLGYSEKEVAKELSEREVRADLARALAQGKYISYAAYRRSI